MILTLPPLDIPEDSPFQNDLFGREELANRLFNLISRLDDGLVMSINAPWGEGKTSFVKMWNAFLRQKEAKCIYFDAFAQDYIDDAFIAITSEIASMVENEFEESQSPKTRLKEFKNKASKAGVKLLSWGAKVGIKAATLGAIKDTDIEGLKEIKKAFVEDGSSLISNFVEQKLDNYKEDIKTIKNFKKELEALSTDIKNETGHPLVFIIDELDRCKPTYALDLIEKIKHFFSVKNIVFVLVMNIAQLECAVRCLYGNDIDALTYLQKFINIECPLPKNVDRYTSDYKKYCNHLYSSHQLNTWEDRENLQLSMAIFSKALGLSLRDMEKCYSNLTLYYAAVTKNTLGIAPVIALLVILKVKFPSIYKKIKNNNISFNELISMPKLTLFFNLNDEDNIIPYLVKWLKLLLITEEEYNNLDEKDEIREMWRSLFRYQLKRNIILPSFCDNLDSFHLAIEK